MYDNTSANNVDVAAIIDSLNMQTQNILNIYYRLSYKKHYDISIIEEKKNINQLKDNITNLHCILHEAYISQKRNYYLIDNFNRSLNILEYFYIYYNQCEIILEIYQLNVNLTTWCNFLFNDNSTCLKEHEYYDIIKIYNYIIDKKTLLHQPINENIYFILNQAFVSYNNIKDIYLIRSKQFLLLNKNQEHFVNLYFQYHKDKYKFSKKITIETFKHEPKKLIQFINDQPDILPLNHSVIIDRNSNKLFAIFSSKTSIVKLFNSCTTTTTGLIGQGTYGKVKLAQDLTNYLIVVVKIQFSTRRNRKVKDIEVSNEEAIQQRLHYFVGSARIHKCKNHMFKYYTFSKYFKGKNLNSYLHDNKDITIEEITRIFIKILKELDYFHNYIKMVHGDLNFLNILYNSTTEVLKIIDFGFSDIADQDGMIRFRQLNFAKNKDKDTLYFAHECYSMQQATYASDIYSLGWWIQLYFQDNQLYPSSRFKNILDGMLNEDYNLRPTVRECIEGFTTLLNNNDIISRISSSSTTTVSSINKNSGNNVRNCIHKSNVSTSNICINKVKPRLTYSL